MDSENQQSMSQFNLQGLEIDTTFVKELCMASILKQQHGDIENGTEGVGDGSQGPGNCQRRCLQPEHGSRNVAFEVLCAQPLIWLYSIH